MPDADQVILEVVRGLRDPSSLSSIGVNVTFNKGMLEIDNATSLLVVAQSRDVAKGLLRLRHDPQALQRWASFLLASSAIIDLSLEDDQYGDVLLEGLWDAHGGGPVRPGAIAAAEELRE